MSIVDSALHLEEISLPSWPFTPLGIAYGLGKQLPLEVLYAEHARAPNPTQLRSAWKSRQDGRGVPLIVVVLQGNKAHVCGPSGEDPRVYPNLDPGQVERACLEALEQPSRHSALRSLRDSLGALAEEGLPGIRNEGFLATHELTTGVPNRVDWVEAGNKAAEAIKHTGADLLLALGYSSERLDHVTDVLKIEGRKNAVAILLTGAETPEMSSERIPGNISAVSYALAKADEENLKWVIVLHGRKIRLYPVDVNVGVGRRGRTETFLECHTGLISDDNVAYLWLLFSSDALRNKGTLVSILESSKDYAGDLATRLRERIYDEVVPRLAEGIAKARGLRNPRAEQLSETYQMAMHVLFRLLFIAYGEDKDLLPYRFNGLYQKRSLKEKAKELLDVRESNTGFGDGDSLWQEIKNIFHAIEKGNRSWGVPAYNGGLFSTSAKEAPIGALLDKVSLPDSVFGPALENLLLVPTVEGILGPVDFRSLGVREFGTIYEGLLESELSIAQTDLTVDTRGSNSGRYRPSLEGEDVIIPKGNVYLQNASGTRNSTGTYYTKSFAVEHILNRVLEPALDAHLNRINDLDEIDASDAFFDFKVADLAMGSGHFLIASIDRIEARMSAYLANRTLPRITVELENLRKAAFDALGEEVSTYPDIEDNSLLRRQIARRCIYGVDLNEIAVQLARLAVWIHTFVPGLPLSLLDRNLVHGNSLVGVGQLSELEDQVRREFGESNVSWIEAKATDFVGEASDALARLGRLTDATQSEIKEARKAWSDADKAIAPAKAVCDILTASLIEETAIPFDYTHWEQRRNQIVGSDEHARALTVLQGMHVLHFPITFPEVFLREKKGFDVLLGNPPWEKAHVEEHEFWARQSPGLRALSQREREQAYEELRITRPDLTEALEGEVRAARITRTALMRGPFPGMGSGHPDLYKAFCWRYWFLVASNGGRIGVVIPRSVLSAKGSEEFRWEIFQNSVQVNATVLYNKSFWIFDMDNRKAIAILDLQRGAAIDTKISISGPFADYESFRRNVNSGTTSFSGRDVLSWTEPAALPLLPTAGQSAEVFLQLRQSPRFDYCEQKHWRAGPIQGDLNATTHKGMMNFSEECPDEFWPVYKGASIDLWNPDTGVYYAQAEPGQVTTFLQEKRLRGKLSRNSIFYECESEWCADPTTLPCCSPRIVFRDVTNRTNQRTMVCALVPPGVFLNHKVPYLVFPRGSHKDIAFLLGVLSSMPLDWFVRRFVETSMAFYVLNSLPIPRPDSRSKLRTRVIDLAGRLACSDPRLNSWATEVGVDCGPIPDDNKQQMIYELDAVVAHLYGLSKSQLIHVFETFHDRNNYEGRIGETIKQYQAWEGR